MFTRSNSSSSKHESFYLILVLSFQISSAIVYELNDTEYKKLPPIFHVDPYQECMEDPAGLYCDCELTLVSDDENPLLNLIREYSASSMTHYNHSLIRYHLCVTKTCNEYYNNTTVDLVDSLEACLNKTFYDLYELKIKLPKSNIHCKSAGEKIEIEVGDICMWTFLIGILTLNLVGSLYDFTCTTGIPGEGIAWLTNFAIRRNWRKLIAPPLGRPGSRKQRLKVLSGVRCLLTLLVVAGHSIFTSGFFIDNPKLIEDIYTKTSTQVFINGNIMVQTFFVISGILMSYNLELMIEKTFHINWMLLPKGIFMRWIRLTPVYAVTLFFTVSCAKYLANGPLWHYVIMSEVDNCKQYWWQHIVYINNYNDVSHCMIHTWYMASEMQLRCLGLVVYIICRTPSCRKVILSILLLVAIVIPMGQTYYQDLDGALEPSPENIVHFVLDNATFNHLYKRGHTNMFSYFCGMIVGYLAYYGQKINYDVQKFRKYRIVYYITLLQIIGLAVAGTVFYREGPKPSLAVRMIFAACQKPFSSILIGISLLASIFKYENFLRGIGEWSSETPLSRLSYCAYLVHFIIIWLIVGQNQTLFHITLLSVSQQMVYALVVTYLVAMLCWLLVEEPFSQILKMKPSGSDGVKRVNGEATSGGENNAPKDHTHV